MRTAARVAAAIMGLLWPALISVSLAGDAAQPSPGAAGPLEIPIRIGGAGGAYFLAEPGPLVVDVEKCDRNRRGTRTELRAILVGPDRSVIQEATIPDDGLAPGRLGPAKRVRLQTQVARKGVYGLNVTVSQDRYGEQMFWGMATNCPKYLIETARGHRDERHQEPLVFAYPGRPVDVCFLPRRGPLSIEIASLPKGVREVSLFDAADRLIHAIPVESGGRAAHTFPAGTHREAVPWRLHLPEQQATVQADGLTRWEPDDLCPNAALWTPQARSFFPLAAYRWLLTPYSRTIYGRPGQEGEIALEVHNNADEKRTIHLAIEFPDGPWPARLSLDRVALRPKQARPVAVRFTAPAAGQGRTCHVRATPAEDPEFSTYSTLVVKAGQSPASRELAIPLVLKPYQHENEQFGYVSDYPVESQLYFDVNNRPMARTAGGVSILHDGRWVTSEPATSPAGARRRAPRPGAASTKVAFDRAGDVYLLAGGGGQGALLHSTDGGKTFATYSLPQRDGRSGTLDIEQFSGHNTPDGPPPLVRFTQTATDPRLIWRRINDLELILPRKEAGRIVFDKPILISAKCIGYAGHSGMPSTVVSRGSRVHVVWAEATEPGDKVPGVPTFVATYDRQTGTLGKPALIGYGPPANDVHNTPSITIDSKGYLHAVAGTHGQPFPYARSLEPNTADAGWTKAEVVAPGESQTYIGLVCGPDDTLHLVFRLWRREVEPFPASHYATLAHQRKPSGKPWEAPRVLIVPPFSEYSVFYHRLTIDRIGRLFLSYDYWSTHWFYRNDQHGSRRAVMMSPDGGNRWKLLQTADLSGP